MDTPREVANETPPDVQRCRSCNPLLPPALHANLCSFAQDDPKGMDELANEAGPDRPTDDFASAKDSLGSAHQLRDEYHPAHATG